MERHQLGLGVGGGIQGDLVTAKTGRTIELYAYQTEIILMWTECEPMLKTL